MTSSLSSFYPLEPFDLVRSRVQKSSKQKFVLGYNETDTGIVVHVQLGDKTANLATFPLDHAVALTILFRKWEYYCALFVNLSDIKPQTPELTLRQRDLQDHWVREICYLDRVLELAIQWANHSPRDSHCLDLCIFLTQEAASTYHGPSDADEQNLITTNSIFDDSESSAPTCSILAHPFAQQ